MDFLGDNVAALGRSRPDLSAALQAQLTGLTGPPYTVQGDPPRDMEVKSGEGSADLLYGDDLAWGERTEAYRSIWKLGSARPEARAPDHALIVLGFGLGADLRALLAELPPEGRLAVFEPDPGVFVTALMTCDLEDVLSDPRFLPLTGVPLEQAVEQIGRDLEWGRFLYLPYRILLHPSAQHFHPRVCESFVHLWNDAIEREGMYLRGRSTHGEVVARHTVANFPRLLDCPGIEPLRGAMNDTPALLVGAGPSLSRNLEVIDKATEKMLVVCVNSAYPVLRKAGIAPHVVIALDHQERNFGSFQDIDHDPRTYLVADPRIDPRIFAEFLDHAYLLSWHTTTETLGQPHPPNAIPLSRGGGNSLYHWLQERLGQKGTITATGSVAVAAYQMLAYWGCPIIALVGLDLAFPDERAYAEGTIFDDKSLPQDSQVTHSVPCTRGGKVGTSATLNLYRQLLEHEILRFGATTWNASLGGALIQGTATMPLKSVVANVEETSNPDVSGQYALACQHDPSLGRDGVLRVALRVLGDDIEGLCADARRILDECKDVDASQAPVVVETLDEGLASLREKHGIGHFILNELLQTAFVDFECARWEALSMDLADRTVADLRRRTAALEAIVTEAERLHEWLQAS